MTPDSPRPRHTRWGFLSTATIEELIIGGVVLGKAVKALRLVINDADSKKLKVALILLVRKRHYF